MAWLPPPWTVTHYCPTDAQLRDGETLLIVTGKGAGTPEEAAATKRLVEMAAPVAEALERVLEDWFPAVYPNDASARPSVHEARAVLARIHGGDA